MIFCVLYMAQVRNCNSYIWCKKQRHPYSHDWDGLWVSLLVKAQFLLQLVLYERTCIYRALGINFELASWNLGRDNHRLITITSRHLQI